MNTIEFVRRYRGKRVIVNNNYPHAPRRIGMSGIVVDTGIDRTHNVEYIYVRLDAEGMGSFLPNELDIIENCPLPLPG